jgi:hypothetical protein
VAVAVSGWAACEGSLVVMAVYFCGKGGSLT